MKNRMTTADAADIIAQIEAGHRYFMADPVKASIMEALQKAFGDGRASVHTPERMLELQRCEANLAAHKAVNQQLFDLVKLAITRNERNDF